MAKDKKERKKGSLALFMGKRPWKKLLRGKVQQEDFPTPLGNPATAAGFRTFSTATTAADVQVSIFRGVQPASPRKRGNPNWGKPSQPIPATATEFELQARQLGLTKQTYTASAELRTWCEHNKNRCYIPEWLLAEWEITVDPNVTPRLTQPRGVS